MPDGQAHPATIPQDRPGPRCVQNRRSRRLVGRGLLTALLAVAGAAPVMALPFQVPALLDPPSQEHHVGKMVFVELVTPDLAAAETFYGGLFGWAFRNVQADGTQYADASLDGQTVAGLVQRPIPPGTHAQPAWLSFFAARDADAAAKAATLNGATLLHPPHSVPNRGREAVLADPTSQLAAFADVRAALGDGHALERSAAFALELARV